jgi:hypothetical protein
MSAIGCEACLKTAHAAATDRGDDMFREHRHNTTTDAAMSGPDRATSGSILPKVIALIAVVGLVRMLASHKRAHGGASSWGDRRREMIAELHRELHRQDDLKADAADPEAGTAKA